MVVIGYGATEAVRVERAHRPASGAAAMIATLAISGMGLVVAVLLISAHTTSPVSMVGAIVDGDEKPPQAWSMKEWQGPQFPQTTDRLEDGSPRKPPLMDHLDWGVGKEDRIERRANWALRVIGKMNGTLLESMIANGTIGGEAEVVDPELVEEIHQAMDEQSKEIDLNAPASEPFPFEAAQQAGATAAPAEAEAEAAETEAEPEAAAEEAPADAVSFSVSRCVCVHRYTVKALQLSTHRRALNRPFIEP